MGHSSRDCRKNVGPRALGPLGWGDALFIALIAWGVVLAVLYVLALGGVVEFDTAGVPGA